MELTEETTGAIYDHLFSAEATNVYALLDAASVHDLPQTLVRMQVEHECLFPGELADDMAAVAPYLARLDPNSEFTAQAIQSGWGEHWGIFIHSDADMLQMRLHLRPLLTVYDPDGRPMRLRYYDPRVLRRFLPVCTPDELDTIFGEVNYFLLEDEDPNVLLRLSRASGALKQERKPLAVSV